MSEDITTRIRAGFREDCGEEDIVIRQKLAHGARQLTLLQSLADTSRRVADPGTLASPKGADGEEEEKVRPVWPWER